MRFNLRLYGRLEDGRECQADISIYVKDEEVIKTRELFRIANESSMVAPWLIQAPGWPDVPEDSTITVEHVEYLDEKKNQPKMPGSLQAFLQGFGFGQS